MTRRISLSLILCVLITATSSAFAPAPVFREPPKPKTPDVFAAMQGTWELEQNINIRGRARGVVLARGRRINQKIRVQGTSWAYIYDNGGVETESTKYEIVLDPKASPATLDLEQSHEVMLKLGGGRTVKQIAMRGIVKVEGDTLTFCYVYGYQQNAERPKEFIAGNQVMPNGTTVVTMTLKRVK